MKRTLLSILLLISAVFTVNAQRQLKVHLADGTTQTWNAWEVDFIDFVDLDPLPAPIPESPVDLGLSVKWSPVNLGASESSQIGNYYGWGDISGLNTSTNLKYFPYTGIADNITKSEYDMAFAAWGYLWRLPTQEEFQELIDNCDWVKVEGGYELTSKINGASIFLPLVGYREGETVDDQFSGLLYWTGDIAEDKDNAICFNSSESTVESQEMKPYEKLISAEELPTYMDPTIYHDLKIATTEDGKLLIQYKILESSSTTESIHALVEKPRYMALAVRPVYGKTKQKFDIKVEKIVTSFDRATISASLVNPDEVVSYGIKVAKDEAGLSTGEFCFSVTKDRNVNGQNVDNPIFEVIGLDAKTTYYFQVFAISATDETVITDVQTFVTEDALYQDEYVDLGTGILWAKWNVGAAKLTQMGEYYAWGELESKETYSAANYDLSFDIPISGNSDENEMTLPIDVLTRKVGNVDGYMISSKENYPDIAGSKYDVAKAKWGGKWRMPTKEEWKKLSQYCNWESVTIPGSSIKGFKVSSKVDSKKFIYLPAGGYKRNTNTTSSGKVAYYWSSTLWTYTEASFYGQKVFDMKCDSSDISGRNFADYIDRFNGCLVRPVMDK